MRNGKNKVAFLKEKRERDVFHIRESNCVCGAGSRKSVMVPFLSPSLTARRKRIVSCTFRGDGSASARRRREVLLLADADRPQSVQSLPSRQGV